MVTTKIDCNFYEAHNATISFDTTPIFCSKQVNCTPNVDKPCQMGMPLTAQKTECDRTRHYVSRLLKKIEPGSGSRFGWQRLGFHLPQALLNARYSKTDWYVKVMLKLCADGMRWQFFH